MSEIRTSEQVNEIARALAKAQAKLENVAKDRENPHFRSRYATLAGVLDEVRPKLAEQGISIFQALVNGEGDNIGVATRLIHSSGQWIESAVFVRPTKFDAQGVGSVASYLRRYSLMAIAGVGQEDDDGNAAVGRPEHAASRAPARRAPPPGEPGDDPFRDDAPTASARPASPPPSHARNGTPAPAATARPALPVSPEEPPEVGEARRAARAHFWARESYAIDPAVIPGGMARWDAEVIAQSEAAQNLDAFLKLKQDNREAGFVSAWENTVATPVIKHFRGKMLEIEKRLSGGIGAAA